MNGAIEYRLEITLNGARTDEIAGLLNFPESNVSAAAHQLVVSFFETEQSPYQDFILLFANALSKNRTSFKRLGIEIDDIFILVLYAYRDRCNLEFSAEQLTAKGDLGIGLGISCWEE